MVRNSQKNLDFLESVAQIKIFRKYENENVCSHPFSVPFNDLID